MDNKIGWMRLKHGQWDLFLAATDQGLCYVGTQNEDFEDLEKWVKKRLPGYVLVEENSLQCYAQELIEFLDGKRKDFTASTALHGTPFQQSVWHALLEIPFGETVSVLNNRRTYRKSKGCACCWNSNWCKSNANHRSMSSGNWKKRLSNWLSWRIGNESTFA